MAASRGPAGMSKRLRGRVASPPEAPVNAVSFTAAKACLLLPITAYAARVPAASHLRVPPNIAPPLAFLFRASDFRPLRVCFVHFITSPCLHIFSAIGRRHLCPPPHRRIQWH